MPADSAPTRPRSFAFYVSGHGYGHATRASALTHSLLLSGHRVVLVSDAPTAPFTEVLPPTNGSHPPSSPASALVHFASYRKVEIEPGVVQPKAYDVDRRATFDVLTKFIEERGTRLEEEVKWLKEEGIEVVISDATFLGCVAASQANIPSILATNFTFDSCYSYLSVPPLLSTSSSFPLPEPAIPAELLKSLVEQAIEDYSHASLLLRLPGTIPLPAFDMDVPMPSSRWVNEERSDFTQEIKELLARPVESIPLNLSGGETPRVPRRVVDVPLIVREPSPLIYTPEFRSQLLSSLGVPTALHSSKILLVSFGGQSVPRPNSKPSLLPPGWIALVCGLTKDQTLDLPENFFPNSNFYVPDLTAVADVILGKLGYGTCSEALSVRTPFVYVPRPLFIEEFGLKRMMISRGVCLEISRTEFEDGQWKKHVLSAYSRGRAAKEEQRRNGWVGEGAGEKMVAVIEDFMDEWDAAGSS